MVGPVRTADTLPPSLWGHHVTRKIWRYGSLGIGEVTLVPGEALAFWLREPGVGEIRPVPLPDPAPDDVLVKTLRSAVSRGTETLVFRGGVPASQYAAMRAPFQDGDFPGPLKYGYLNVGVVERGPAQLQGRIVFCLYPHQTRYVVPASSVVVVPDDVPPARAVLRRHPGDRSQRVISPAPRHHRDHARRRQ